MKADKIKQLKELVRIQKIRTYFMLFCGCYSVAMVMFLMATFGKEDPLISSAFLLPAAAGFLIMLKSFRLWQDIQSVEAELQSLSKKEETTRQ